MTASGAGAPLETGHVVAGRYRVETRIGEGGMGAVYLVRHVHTDEALALKVLHAHVLRDEQAVERFRREARAPARIASEHIARVTDADTAADLDGAPFYVMELLRGRDLERVLEDEKRIAPALVVEYLRQTARALDKAHGLRIVHRDLKPENLFLTHREDGSPCIKLLDFGIARLGDTNAGHLKTQAGFIFGTPAFMAPEQTVGDVDRIGPATDVWALGLVAFKLLVGVDFWEARTTAHLCAVILNGPIPTPSERGSPFGVTFDAWFARCVARPIEERFASAGEAVKALADALGVPLEKNRTSSSSIVAASEVAPRGHGSRPSGGEIHLTAPLMASPMVASSHPPPAAPMPPLVMTSEPPPRARSGVATFAAIAGGAVVLAAIGGVLFFFMHGHPAKAAAVDVDERALVASAAVPVTVPAPLASTPSAIPTAAPDAGVTSAASVATNAPERGVRAPSMTTTGVHTQTPATKDAPPAATMTRDQRRRLESLQRMCDQGTFTAAECQGKRAAIVRGRSLTPLFES